MATPADSAKVVRRTVLSSLTGKGLGGRGTSSSTTRPAMDSEYCSRELPRIPELSAVPSVMLRNRCPEK